MLIIDLPSWPVPRKIDWKARQPSQLNRSEFTGKSRAVILAEAPYWTAQVEYQTIVGEARFRPWRSAFLRLQGRANAFRLSACEGPQHRALHRVVVDGAGQSGFTIATRGWETEGYLLDGMLVTIGEDLHQVVATTPLAGIDGKLELSVMPQIKGGIADGVAIETRDPWALMRLSSDDQGWTVDAGQEYSISFSCEGA